MCHQEVERELLEKYSTDGKMSVKQQTAFCRLHKRQSAAKAGTEKGYPKIDWETMDSRCSAYQDFLQNILEGTRASHYRKILKERVGSGKNRTLLTNHDNLTPGYYGPRGLQIMTEYIMGTLSDVIRRRAVEDKLISARTYTGYVQTVLVPELAVRLIMEDMSITEERARDVLKESIEIGELLHEEARDVVKIDEKEENSWLEP
ncbi:RTC4-like domain-containing protein [Xylaria flabelliformis]|nr:RTC4-like domain-containing protein [Xylaria flabelliformis]